MADTLARHWAAPRPPGQLAALVLLVQLWMRRAAARQELMNLDAAQMHDCGLDPLAIRREALKPFWRE